MKLFLSQVLVLGTLGFGACVPPEPAHPSKAERPCVTEPEEQAMVLATIGDLHLSTPAYPLSRVGDAMDAFRPDAVLFDVAPTALRGDREVEAPVELAYVAHVAGTRGSDVFGVGQRPVGGPEGDRDPSADADAGPAATFDSLNGAAAARRVDEAQNARARRPQGDPGWARDEAWLEHETDAAIDVKKPKRVLVLTGALHRAAMESHLRSRGYLVKDPVAVLAGSKVERDPARAPDAVLAAWTRQLATVRAEAAREAPVHDRAWLAWRAAVLELALRRSGGCCVTAGELPRLKAL